MVRRHALRHALRRALSARAEIRARRESSGRSRGHSHGQSHGRSRGRKVIRVRRVVSRTSRVAAVVVAAAAAAGITVVAVEAAVAVTNAPENEKRDPNSGPAFFTCSLVLIGAQRERSRGRRTRKKKIPISMAPTPIIASAGRIVAVFGAISPSAAASLGVIEGSGDADSPFEVREMGAPPPASAGTSSAAGAPGAPGAPAIDASWRGCAESPGAMSVESDIVVSAVGATAPGGAEAIAVA